ncbi:5-methylcytosine restriction system specificity protein McrC [Sinorhizobium fredii]|uniref:5-methylcytosine restriction system specificity protein McrC n=1 Tax=Rhizobium fredii TaxID=380 RepID=UPI0009B6B27A|nr:hypothetical protein [Sinorhizobium fredii]ASY71338.1 hypothetical protein SF83666_c39510 [Sinorhizobium fredii CCBAU 83666]
MPTTHSGKRTRVPWKTDTQVRNMTVTLPVFMAYCGVAASLRAWNISHSKFIVTLRAKDDFYYPVYAEAVEVFAAGIWTFREFTSYAYEWKDTARSPLLALAGVNRPYLTDEATSSSVTDFLATNLVDAVRVIIANGLHKEYEQVSEVTDHPRGRLDMIGTVRSCWSRGHHHRVQTRRYEQTSDIVVNRILKAALKFILTRSRTGWRASSKLVSATNEAYLTFSKLANALQPRDLMMCEQIVNRGDLPSARAYYYRALDIALLVLSNRSISLQQQGDEIELGTFIINFENLFEDYLRRVLQDRCEPLYWVRDGNLDGKKPLFDDRREPPAQPDIVIVERATKQKLVAEVKYKDRPNRDDINQAITYALSYRTNCAILIHQRAAESASGIQKIGTVNGIELHSYAFDLSKADLQSEEESLANCLFALVGSSADRLKDSPR